MHFEIKKGLDIPISGKPAQHVEAGNDVTKVAILGQNYIGMKPTMLVSEGDKVTVGQALFSDKKNPGVIYTSPANGVVDAINRGAKRVLLSVVIRLEGDQKTVLNNDHNHEHVKDLDVDDNRKRLIASGLWTAFKTRPYSKIPAINSTADAIFINAMDSNPLAADPSVVIGMHHQDFKYGISIISGLTKGHTYITKEKGASIEVGDKGQAVTFSGPHPAGLPGTHIHYVYPVNDARTVWTIDYQDVIAIGKLFGNGEYWNRRVISLAGPVVKKPRLVETYLGADLTELTKGESDGNESIRVISGSVLSGDTAIGAVAFLGRYHTQVSMIQESGSRDLFAYLRPGGNKYSATRALISALNRSKQFPFNSMKNGSERAMVPIGHYEMVMPLDILPTQLLRAIVVGDTDTAQQLGCLELDEEDLALCSFISSSKYDYSPVLRMRLEQIEKEG